MKQKKSLKPIPPSLRGKKRYVLFKLEADGKLSEAEVKKALWENFLRLFGEIGTGRQKLWFIGFNSGNGKGIVRCALKALDEVKAGLVFWEKVGKTPVLVEILRVSGSVSKLK